MPVGVIVRDQQMGEILTANNLKDEDIQKAKDLVYWFKIWKQQGRLPMTQAYLIERLKETKGWDYTLHSFPSLINYMRHELDEWIISSNSGLDYAVTDKEKKDFIEYQEMLIMPRLKTLNWAKNKYAKEKNNNQSDLFADEANSEDKTNIVDVIVNQLGGEEIGNE